MSRKLFAVVLAAGVLGASAIVPTTASAEPDPTIDEDLKDQAATFGFQLAEKETGDAPVAKVGRPEGPNPYVSLLEDPSTADYAAWDKYLAKKAQQRNPESAKPAKSLAALRRAPATIVVDEDEPDGTRGSNDTYQTAQPVDGFGTGRRDQSTARILGQLDNEEVDFVQIRPNREDDGSIPLARNTRVGSRYSGITTSGTVGDGPYGSSAGGSGDFDAYKVRGEAGLQLIADIDTDYSSELDSVVALFDSNGEIVASNDDDQMSLDSRLSVPLPEDGTYYLFVAGFFSVPEDPFDSSSGLGAESEGDYNLAISVSDVDVDTYAVDLEVGDVLGLSVAGSANYLGIQDSSGTLVHGSQQDASFIYPPVSPLPGGGNAVNDHVVDEAGMHYISVAGDSGRYDVTAEVYRPGTEGEKVQTLYLDFDGARLNTNIFGGPGVRTLSPMRSFLAGWGLTNADYEPVARQVIDTVTENVRRDLRRSGVDPDTRVRIRNSLDHRDTFGKRDNVSRIVIGGTIDESGIGTIGIAQSIDPGNFDQAETALVLLDVLSDGDPGNPASLNTYLRPGSDKVQFVGTAIGNVTSHEAGHYFGDWHVDQFNDTLNLMDQGGNFPLLFGVGDDGVGGTADDPDVDFGEDEFNPNEGFTGIEDTLGRLAAALLR
ncbi:MAG: pre-peptidase C-terminal domain-containing protein [Ornithinimicrobium sp.]